MSSPSAAKRRSTQQITLIRASRLHRLVRLLTENAHRRDELLADLKIGLRTFYRELELLHKLGIKVIRDQKSYSLKVTLESAETRLPFPDPQLSFAEMRELAKLPGETPRRLAALLESVINPSQPKARAKRKAK